MIEPSSVANAIPSPIDASSRNRDRGSRSAAFAYRAAEPAKCDEHRVAPLGKARADGRTRPARRSVRSTCAARGPVRGKLGWRRVVWHLGSVGDLRSGCRFSGRRESVLRSARGDRSRQFLGRPHSIRCGRLRPRSLSTRAEPAQQPTRRPASHGSTRNTTAFTKTTHHLLPSPAACARTATRTVRRCPAAVCSDSRGQRWRTRAGHVHKNETPRDRRSDSLPAPWASVSPTAPTDWTRGSGTRRLGPHRLTPRPVSPLASLTATQLPDSKEQASCAPIAASPFR